MAKVLSPPLWNRPLPLLSSFLGFFDIKLGVTIISLLALLNKVAGVYGILAIFSGGSLTQLSMYIYSILTIGLVIYGLQATGEENARRTFIYSNCLLLDHLISTVFTILFGISWYIDNPHDGRRIANSDAQKDMMNPNLPTMTPELRKEAAQAIWKAERSFATTILVFVWLSKLYFILVVYSFALHLRRGSYTHLPLSKPPSTITNLNRFRVGSTTNLSHRSTHAYPFLAGNNQPDLTSPKIDGDYSHHHNYHVLSKTIDDEDGLTSDGNAAELGFSLGANSSSTTR